MREDGSIADLTASELDSARGSRADNLLAYLEDDGKVHQAAEDVVSQIGSFGEVEARSRGLTYHIDEVELEAPLIPKKIVAVLVNSQGMLGGTDIKLSHPRLFMKAASTVIGPEQLIRAPPSGVRAEVELGIVIGGRISKAEPKVAERAIFGYTIFNDVTAPRDSKEDAYPAYRRDAATGELRKTMLRGPLFRSKNHDTFAPMGPWIVTREELTDVGNLKMQTRFNHEVIQDGSTSEYLFSPKEILSFISQFLTLEPGDLVSAGTIGWDAAGRSDADPSEWILPSVEGSLELEIEGIGVLRNPVKPEV